MPFKQEYFNDMIVDWVASKYLPFSFFNDEKTQNIFFYINKHAKVPKKTELRTLCAERFTKLQSRAMNLLQNNDSKISFTIDGWTSVGNNSYYGVTAHFIDHNWKLQTLVIDFLPSNGKHTGKDIAQLFYNMLCEHRLTEKIQGITLDNAAANTTFVKELAKLITSAGINFDASDNHFRCFGHILNLGAQDLMRVLKTDTVNRTVGDIEIDQVNCNIEVDDTSVDDDYIDAADSDIDFNDNDDVDVVDDLNSDGSRIIDKLRELLKKIKYSEQLALKLKSSCETVNLKIISPNIDVSTRWNSSQDMMQSALAMRPALNLLCENNISVRKFSLSDSEWTLISRITQILRHFKSVSTLFSGEKYVTLPLVIVGFNMLIDKIENIARKIDKIINPTLIDSQIKEAILTAREKLIKHYDKCNWLYCVAVILDPRQKLETFKKTTWGQEMEREAMRKFNELFNSKYFVLLENIENCQPEMIIEHEDSDADIDFKSLFKFTNNMGNTASGSINEVEKYLSTAQIEGNEDILHWWKCHRTEFPNLSRMAKDIFSVTATSVPAERLFSRASLTIRKHRNRLNAESARLLLCLQSWVTCDLKNDLM